MEYTHETLRALFKRSVRQKFTLSELEIALELHADAWKEQLRVQRVDERRHCPACGKLSCGCEPYVF